MVPLATCNVNVMNLCQQRLAEVTSLLDYAVQNLKGEIAVVSQTMVDTADGDVCRVRERVAVRQPAVTFPLEEPQEEAGYHDAPRVEVQMVSAPKWEPGDGESKGKHLTEPSTINGSVAQRFQLPQEVMLLNLEEAEEGIRLVGKHISRPIIGTFTNTITISASAPEVLEEASYPDRDRLLQATQDTSPLMKQKNGEDVDNGSNLPAENDTSVTLLEGSVQDWLGCCLCYEVFPSKETLHFHVETIHQQPKTVPCQVSCHIIVNFSLKLALRAFHSKYSYDDPFNISLPL